MAVNVDNDVKQLIVDVSQLDETIDDLSDNTTLTDQNFNALMCNDLAQRLDNYVKSVKPGTWVNNAEITSDMTVAQVIGLVKERLGQ
ncbi:MAG: hypothetical protein ACTHJ8_04225 [Mucilaginibacter sp.]|jgi:hypothetical protein